MIGAILTATLFVWVGFMIHPVVGGIILVLCLLAIAHGLSGG